MRWLFIINPTAGKVDASVSLMPRIRAAAARAGIEPSIVVTRHAGHAREITAACAESGEEVRVYACGGEREPCNEVAAGGSRERTDRRRLHPCGSGNDYVRNFGTQADFLNLDAQFVAECRQADLIRTPQGYGIDIYAAGIDAQVANGIAKWRRVPLCGGTTAYTLSILEAACSTFRHRLRIQTDQGEMEGIYMMLAVCNAQTVRRRLLRRPLRQHGRRPAGRGAAQAGAAAELAGLLKGYRQGRHLAPDGTVEAPFRPYMTFLRTSQIDIRVLDEKPLIATLDGECSPQMHLHAEVARRGVRILLPPELARNTPVLQVMGE